jgi:hypothetical protein
MGGCPQGGQEDQARCEGGSEGTGTESCYGCCLIKKRGSSSNELPREFKLPSRLQIAPRASILPQ